MDGEKNRLKISDKNRVRTITPPLNQWKNLISKFYRIPAWTGNTDKLNPFGHILQGPGLKIRKTLFIALCQTPNPEFWHDNFKIASWYGQAKTVSHVPGRGISSTAIASVIGSPPAWKDRQEVSTATRSIT
jgi:hypothetical protein